MSNGPASKKAKSPSHSATTRKSAKPLPTAAELDLLWRDGDAAFIGPVEPPMVRWIRLGSPKSAWELKAEARRGAQT